LVTAPTVADHSLRTAIRCHRCAEVLAGDPTTVVAGEERHHGGNISGRAEAAER
jgi:5'-deoxynucleotidase YfbR-like HD superfamily hydrolase